MIGSCPDCNGKLSSNARQCPHCGYQQLENPAAVEFQRTGGRALANFTIIVVLCALAFLGWLALAYFRR